MTASALFTRPELAAIMAVAGLAFGAIYFAALKRGVTLFVSGRGWRAPLALMLLRLGAAILFLVLAAKLGAAPLLAAFLGLLAARVLAVRAARKAG